MSKLTESQLKRQFNGWQSDCSPSSPKLNTTDYRLERNDWLENEIRDRRLFYCYNCFGYFSDKNDMATDSENICKSCIKNK